MTLKFGVDAAKKASTMRRLPLVIVGTKIDDIDANINVARRHTLGKTQPMARTDADVVQRAVCVEMVKAKYCVPYHAPYIEVSSRCCVNVEQLFQIATREA